MDDGERKPNQSLRNAFGFIAGIGLKRPPTETELDVIMDKFDGILKDAVAQTVPGGSNAD